MSAAHRTHVGRSKVTREVLSGLLLCALVSVSLGVATPSVANESQVPQLTRYPYLTDMTQSSVGLNWGTDRSATRATVTWGRAGVEPCTARTTTVSRMNINVNGEPRYQWRATLAGLQPETAYCYRVFLNGLDLLGSDPSPTFRSAVAPGSSSFRFAALGDWGVVDDQGRNDHQASILRLLATSGARFVMNTGDTPNGSGSQTNYGDLHYPQSAIFARDFWAVPGRSLPFYPPLGNHGMRREFLDNWPQSQLAAASKGVYAMRTYCCLHGTRSESRPSGWYAFTAGNARFYVLQAAWPNGNVGTSDMYQLDHDYHWTPTSEQYQWLEADLAQHAATPLKFAFFHFPLYSDNNTERSDMYLRVDGPSGWDSLEGLLARNQVSIVFNGHAHIYQRNQGRYGLVSYVTGGGGARLAPIGKCSATTGYAIGWSNSSSRGSSCNAPRPTEIGQVYHYLLVDVDGYRVTVTPVSSLGDAFDQQTYDFSPAGRDVNPPTAPPYVEVVTSTETNLEVKWGESSDDVGVVGYRVHLDGERVAETEDTSHWLRGLSCATTYEIGVDALDAAGNVSELATASGTTAPCSQLVTVYSDDFESGDFAAGGWTTAGMIVQSDVVDASGGTWAARATGAGTTSSAWANLPGTYDDVHYELRFNLVERGSNSVNLFRAQRTNGGSLAGLSISPTGRLSLRNDVAGVTTVSTTAVPPGQWHTVRLHLRIDGSSSLTEVWLDDQPVPELTTTATLGSSRAGRIQIGETAAGRSYDVAIDDVIVSIPR
jgi:hypothetical protein